MGVRKRFCKRGHDTEATGRTGKAECSVCHSEEAKRRYADPEYRKRVQARSKAWCDANRERISVAGRAYRRKNQERIRARRAQAYLRERDDPGFRAFAKARDKAYYAANKEKVREKARAYYAANKERMRARYDPVKARTYDLARRFNISLEDVRALLDEQHGPCALCDKPDYDKRNDCPRALAVDHDHATGKMRGLLCANCNHALGMAHDDPFLLRRMADYIEAHRVER